MEKTLYFVAKNCIAYNAIMATNPDIDFEADNYVGIKITMDEVIELLSPFYDGDYISCCNYFHSIGDPVKTDPNERIF